MAIQISGNTVIDNNRKFYGDGSNLTGIAISVSDGFVPADEKVISVNTTFDNDQENISFAEDLVIDSGVTFTVGAGTTLTVDALAYLNPDVLSIPSGNGEDRPSVPVTGSIRFNVTDNRIEIYNGTVWRYWNSDGTL